MSRVRDVFPLQPLFWVPNESGQGADPITNLSEFRSRENQAHDDVFRDLDIMRQQVELYLSELAAAINAITLEPIFGGAQFVGTSFFAAGSSDLARLLEDISFLAGAGIGHLRMGAMYDGAGPDNSPISSSTGDINPDPMSALHSAVDLALSAGMSVDLSFFAENASVKVIEKGWDNIQAEFTASQRIVFDLVSARRIAGGGKVSSSDLATIFTTLKTADPTRLITCSTPDTSPADAAATYLSDNSAGASWDYLAPHFTPGASWDTEIGDRINELRDALNAGGFLRRIHMQQESRITDGASVATENFLEAATNAFAALALGFNFDTPAGDDMSSQSYQERLQPEEFEVIEGLAATLAV